MELDKLVKFDQNGLVPAIIQDSDTNEVLMLAHMNIEALARTMQTGKTHFWSRSRKKIWLKGETSGHYQTVCEVFFDCDADALLFKVHQKGGACHEGFKSCFFRKITGQDGGFEITGKKIFDPAVTYKSDA
jgi:phosphoribosyl-AMP cyclohydrolase